MFGLCCTERRCRVLTYRLPTWILKPWVVPRYFGLLLLTLWANHIRAQEVQVRFRDEVTRAPLIGALVGLARDSALFSRTLTGESGRATLRAPVGGLFRVRVDRIGFQGWMSEPFELAAGQVVVQDLLVPSLRRDLPTIVVQGESMCGVQSVGSAAAAALWEEVRLALEASEITLREGQTPLWVREFGQERGLDLSPQRRWITRAAVEAGAPFRSLEPSQLATEGFVRYAGSSADFRGPDGALLLSDEFTATHCFVLRPAKDGLVGLGFEPVPGRPQPDIRGTLWLDEQTSELRTLEFAYTNLPSILEAPEVGGRIEYERLDDGGWVVREWHIRMPRLGTRRADTLGQRLTLARLDGYLDRGGMAEVSTDPESVVTHATLLGLVFDSTTGRGMPGVRIEVDGIADSIRTDEDGRFAVHTKVAGDRLVTARHSKLGMLGRSATRTALLSIGDTTTVEFGVIPAERFAGEVCGPLRNRSGIVGVALGPNEVPVIDIAVRASWRTSNGRNREERGRFRSDGLFGFCDLPPDVPISVEVHVRSRVLARTVVELSPRAFQWVELRTDEPGLPTVPPSDGRRIVGPDQGL